MGRMRIALVVGLGAGCTPDAEGGLHRLGTGPEPARNPLGERALAGGGVVLLSGPAADLEGLELVSDDPSVVEAVPLGELLGDDALPPDDTVLLDPDTDTAWVALRASAPGWAFVSLVDPTTGMEVDALELEVRAAERLTLRPAGAWHVERPLPPRVIAGVEYAFEPVLVDGDGVALEGRDPEREIPVLAASPPGVVTVAGVEVTVVSPDAVVGLTLEPGVGPHGERGLVALGVDRTGAPVLGLPAAWTEVQDPARRGDVFAYLPGAETVEVEARYGALVATGTVHTDGPGVVGHSDRPLGCATGPAPATLGAGVPLLLLVRRRSRR